MDSLGIKENGVKKKGDKIEKSVKYSNILIICYLFFLYF